MEWPVYDSRELPSSNNINVKIKKALPYCKFEKLINNNKYMELS